MADERKLIVQILGDERSLVRAFRGSGKEARRFEATLGRSSRNITRALGFTGAIGGLTGLSLALRSTINASINFESSFAGVRKTVDATEPQLQALAKGFRAMSREIPVSIAEINRIGEAAGQLGVQRSAIVDFTRTVADLGATTNLTSEQAADAFARLANITGLPQEQFDRMGSAVVDLGNKLAATESEILDFSLRIAGAGRQVGLTEAQILAISGAFSSVGVEAERGGSAVSKVLLSINSAVLSGDEKLALFAQTAGQTAEQFREAFQRDAGQALVGFVEGLDRVRRSGGNTFKVLKDLGLTDIRLVSAFQAAAGAGDLLSRSLDIGTRAFRENNALAEEAGKRYATAGSRLQVFRNRVNDLQITLGDVLVPVLEEIVTPLSDWLEQTENQAKLQRELSAALKQARGAIKGAADVILPLAEGARETADALGGTRQAVRLLLVAMAVTKVTKFALGIETLGTQSVVATGRVRALRLALLRLGAIGAIVVGIEIVINRKKFYDEAADVIKGLGRRVGLTQTFDLEPRLRIERLREQLRKVNQMLGESSGRAQELREQIAAARLELFEGKGGIGPRPEEGRGAREAATAAARAEREAATAIVKERESAADAARRAAAAAKRAKEKAIEAFGVLMESFDLRLDQARVTKGFRDELRVLADQEAAIQRQIQIEGRTTALERQLFDVRRERASIRRQMREQAVAQLQARQFRALGLDAAGGERVASAQSLKGRLATLRDQVKGTFLDTGKTRSELQRIARVLSGEFGKVGRDVRASIQQMLADIQGELRGDGAGARTKFRVPKTADLVKGLGLDPEEMRKVRQILARRGPGGTMPRSGGGLGGAFGMAVPVAAGGGGGSDRPIHVHLDVNGRELADVVIRETQKRSRRMSGKRSGRRTR